MYMHHNYTILCMLHTPMEVGIHTDGDPLCLLLLTFTLSGVMSWFTIILPRQCIARSSDLCRLGCACVVRFYTALCAEPCRWYVFWEQGCSDGPYFLNLSNDLECCSHFDGQVFADVYDIFSMVVDWSTRLMMLRVDQFKVVPKNWGRWCYQGEHPRSFWLWDDTRSRCQCEGYVSHNLSNQDFYPHPC